MTEFYRLKKSLICKSLGQLLLIAVCLFSVPVEAQQSEDPDSESSTTKVEMIVQRDVPYAVIKGVDKKFLSLDIYRAKSAKSQPILVMVHGGAWRMGDKSNRGVSETKANYFVKQGFVFVSINYRLSPAVQHPKHTEDVAAALAWIKRYAKNIGGDAKKISIMGHSAGAHLVALVATNETYLKAHEMSINDIKHVICLDSAAFDIEGELKSDQIRIFRRKMLEAAFGQDPKQWRAASPVHFIDPKKQYPAFLMFWTGKRQDAKVAAEAMEKKLKAAKAKAVVVHAADRNHSQMNKKIGESDDSYTKTILQFLKS